MHRPLSRLFFDQSAWSFGSMPKIKLSTFFSTRLHYEEAMTSLRTPREGGVGKRKFLKSLFLWLCWSEESIWLLAHIYFVWSFHKGLAVAVEPVSSFRSNETCWVMDLHKVFNNFTCWQVARRIKPWYTSCRPNQFTSAKWVFSIMWT